MTKGFLKNTDIFKFQDCNEYLFSSIENNTFYFASISQFNDPFESLFNVKGYTNNDAALDFFYEKVYPETCLQHISDSSLRDEIVKNRNSLNLRDGFLWGDLKDSLYSYIEDFFGVVCFSKSYNNLLMWAHYANSGKGVCQIFDRQTIFSNDISDSIKMLDVNYYTDKLPEVFINISENNIGYDIVPIISSKRNDWEYESEVRGYINMAQITPFMSQSRELINAENGKLRNIQYNGKSLKGIVFGHKCDELNIDMVKERILNNPNLNIKEMKFFQAKCDNFAGNLRFREI